MILTTLFYLFVTDVDSSVTLFGIVVFSSEAGLIFFLAHVQVERAESTTLTPSCVLP